jgi:ribosomal protein S18 acetylase RimI-like enzyme
VTVHTFDDGMTLRRATPADSNAIFHIMFDDPGPDEMAIGGSLEGARTVGRISLAHGVSVSIQRALIGECDGQAVALLETMLPDEDLDVGAGTVLKLAAAALTRLGPAGLVRLLRWSRVRGAVELSRVPQSYYIAHIDVLPALRGRGIGSQLLAYAESQARERVFSRMSLVTWIGNPAQRLYERQGFRVVDERRSAAFERVAGFPGRVLMARELV